MTKAAELRAALAELRQEINMVDEVYWTQPLFEIVERVDYLLSTTPSNEQDDG